MTVRFNTGNNTGLVSRYPSGFGGDGLTALEAAAQERRLPEGQSVIDLLMERYQREEKNARAKDAILNEASTPMSGWSFRGQVPVQRPQYFKSVLDPQIILGRARWRAPAHILGAGLTQEQTILSLEAEAQEQEHARGGFVGDEEDPAGVQLVVNPNVKKVGLIFNRDERSPFASPVSRREVISQNAAVRASRFNPVITPGRARNNAWARTRDLDPAGRQPSHRRSRQADLAELTTAF